MKYVVVLFAFVLFFSTCKGDEAAVVGDTSGGDPGIAQLDAEILANPGNAELYAARASMWYDKNNYDAAISDLTNALAIDSTNVEYHWHLSDVYLDYFRSRLALRTLERAVRLEPNNVETQLRLAEAQVILEQYDEAVVSLNQVIRLDARNPDAYMLLSEAFLATGDTARAIKSAEEATEINPDETDGFIRVGKLLFEKGLPRAEQYFDAAIAIDPSDPVALHAKADFYRDNERIPEAIAQYRAASMADRSYVAGHFNAGLLLMELDSVEVAKTEFDLVIKNDPIHIRAYFFRGYARELMADFAGAREDYQTALRFAPGYEYALEGMERLDALKTEE